MPTRLDSCVLLYDLRANIGRRRHQLWLVHLDQALVVATQLSSCHDLRLWVGRTSQDDRRGGDAGGEGVRKVRVVREVKEMRKREATEAREVMQVSMEVWNGGEGSEGDKGGS